MYSRSYLLNLLVTFSAIQLSMTSDLSYIFNVKKCPSPDLYETLDLPKYIGKWYKQAALPSWYIKGKCGSNEYYYNDKNTTLYNQHKEKRGNKWVFSPLSTVTLDTPGVLTDHMTFVSADLNVLDTDYTSYSIVYSCTNHWFIDATKWATILTRKANLTQEEKEDIFTKAEGFFKKAEIDITDLIPMIQDCDE